MINGILTEAPHFSAKSKGLLECAILSRATTRLWHSPKVSCWLRRDGRPSPPTSPSGYSLYHLPFVKLSGWLENARPGKQLHTVTASSHCTCSALYVQYTRSINSLHVRKSELHCNDATCTCHSYVLAQDMDVALIRLVMGGGHIVLVLSLHPRPTES